MTTHREFIDHGATRPPGRLRRMPSAERTRWRARAGRRTVRPPRSHRGRPAREDGRRARALRRARGDGPDGTQAPDGRAAHVAARRIACAPWTSRASTSRRSASTRYWYKADRDVAAEAHPTPERDARRVLRGASRALRGLRVGGASASRPRRRAARGGRQEATACAAPPSAAASTAQSWPTRSFHPFWAKAEQLGVLVFIHPQGTAELERTSRLKGNGVLDNIIGNPLETTIALSHLIFEGTLDRFPGLKICAAHGGGYLPSYAARSDAGAHHLPRPLHRDAQEEADRVPAAALLRLDRLHARGAAAPGGGDGLGPDRHGHRLSVPVDAAPRWTTSSARRA